MPETSRAPAIAPFGSLQGQETFIAVFGPGLQCLADDGSSVNICKTHCGRRQKYFTRHSLAAPVGQLLWFWATGPGSGLWKIRMKEESRISVSTRISSSDDRKYCAEVARSFDYERYFAAVFAPPDIRASLMALYAFNFEIASVPERVSELLTGEMRLQWWRDAIAEIYDGGCRRHAVVRELAVAIDRHDLPRLAFDRLIEARSAELCRPDSLSLDMVKAHANETAGVLSGLAGRACVSGVPPTAVEDAGVVWGLVGFLRILAFHGIEEATGLQSAGLAKKESRLRNAGPREEDPELATLVRSVSKLSEELLTINRRNRSALLRAYRPAIGYLGVADVMLRRLRRTDYRLGPARLELLRLRKQMAIVKSIAF